ncbi:DNA polymerase III, delta prime subunit [Candidatus Moduliflexus flocculans]|uniref:DNA polymerase III subunit delta' n=1 Tax=Candidatus Moduliflexus flocculans TaxID=1499966 RepID=A0A0S6W530_9BACT|nr:DNA polymerase III, delta prime subunit [Candidatus Moduliflexus flocculans]
MAFSEIIGQENAIKILQRALRHQRVPQAYLFAGDDGVGKKLTALTLAKALNCKELQDDACERCGSCHKINIASHPDVRLIEPDGQFIKIDQIRDMQKDAGLKPFEGRRKVYIIDQADTMRAEAANALLKTLEEPTADCVIILVTANVYALLPTVLSRCQFVRFTALGVDKLAELLQKRLRLMPERARLIASLSEGCPGRALGMDADSLLKQRDEMERLLQAISGGLQDVRVIFTQVERLTDTKDDKKDAIHDFLDLLLVWYRDMLLLHEGGDPRLVANSDAIPRLKPLADALTAAQLRRLFETVYQTKQDILRNANLQLALEVMLISLTEVYNDRNRWREVSANRQSV